MAPTRINEANYFTIPRVACSLIHINQIGFTSITLLIMLCLSDHERSGAIGMLPAGVRVSDVARHYNCHRSTILRLRDLYQATGSVKE